MKSMAICFLTKDRPELTRQTLPALMRASENFDVFWLDGSKTDEGKQLPNLVPLDDKGTLPANWELHENIGGGADFAILYALSLMLERGYDYCGLLENDVLLHDGWFEKCRDLLKISECGSVSARCMSDRILLPLDGYAVMANVGAGMQILTRKAAESVLDYYRNGSFGEYAFWPTYFTGLRPPVPREIEAMGTTNAQMSADWSFESSIMKAGLLTLAPTPTMAHNIDQSDDKLQITETIADESFDFPKFLLNFRMSRPVSGFAHFDPAFKFFYANPTQILKALPDAFSGSWEACWLKHNGPFGLKTTKGDESLSFPIYGAMASLLLDTGGQEVTIHARIRSGTSILKAKSEKGLDFVRIDLGEFNNHEIELSFDKPGVTIGTVVFDNPQPWFRDGYVLRYDDLKPFLGGLSPAISEGEESE